MASINQPPQTFRIHVKPINIGREYFESYLNMFVVGLDWRVNKETYTMMVTQQQYGVIVELQSKLAEKGKTIVITKGGL